VVRVDLADIDARDNWLSCVYLAEV
jgi:hypothetical protein